MEIWFWLCIPKLEIRKYFCRIDEIALGDRSSSVQKVPTPFPASTLIVVFCIIVKHISHCDIILPVDPRFPPSKVEKYAEWWYVIFEILDLGRAKSIAYTDVDCVLSNNRYYFPLMFALILGREQKLHVPPTLRGEGKCHSFHQLLMLLKGLLFQYPRTLHMMGHWKYSFGNP